MSEGDEIIWPAGKYTFPHAVKTLRRQLPRVLDDLYTITPGFMGDERLTRSQRLAMQIRLSKLMGCPVCVSFFPALAKKAEFDEDQIQDAMLGGLEALSPEVCAAARRRSASPTTFWCLARRSGRV